MDCRKDKRAAGRARTVWFGAIATAFVFTQLAVDPVLAQLPDNVVSELHKLGQVVEPGCTAKLIRPMMPRNDYNTYWPVDAAEPNARIKLYSGVTLARDVSFGPESKDLIDIFSPDKGGSNRTVLIYVPGGAGNKIEQQSVEANAFYDNIGRWAAENGMVGVTMQRGGSPGGENIAIMINWLQQNVSKYKGNSDRMFIWAHSAGNGPLGQYIGRPDLYGVGVKGAIFMSGNPVNFGGSGGRGGAPAGAGARGGGPRGGGPGGAGAGGGARGAGQPGQIGTSECINTAGAGSQAGVIRGPSSSLPDNGREAAARRAELAGSSPFRWTGKQWVSTGTITAAPAAGRGGAPGAGAGGGRGAAGARGAGGARGGPGGPAAAGGGRGPAQADQPNPLILGFQTTRAAILLARAELDPGVNGGMLESDIAIHDELCKLEGPKAKDGVGHCPTMLYLKGQSHMSEVFSIGSADKSVSGPILEWIKQVP